MTFVQAYQEVKSMFYKPCISSIFTIYKRIIELSLDRLDKVIESRNGPPDTGKETNLVKRKEEKATPKPKKQKRSSTSTTPVR